MKADPRQLIAAKAARLQKLLKKHAAGKKLTRPELEEIGAVEPAAKSSGGTKGAQGGGAGVFGEQSSFDSMAAAAAALGIPKATIQWAKDRGLPGFKGSRVYPLLLLPALEREREKNPGAPLKDKRTVETEILIEKLDQLRWEKERERGEWIRFAEVKEWQVTKAEGIKSLLRSRLKNELPPKLEGLSSPEIAAKMEGVIAEIVGLLRSPVGETNAERETRNAEQV